MFYVTVLVVDVQIEDVEDEQRNMERVSLAMKGTLVQSGCSAQSSSFQSESVGFNSSSVMFGSSSVSSFLFLLFVVVVIIVVVVMTSLSGDAYVAVFFNFFSEAEPFAAILIAHGTPVFWGAEIRDGRERVLGGGSEPPAHQLGGLEERCKLP